MHVCTHENPFFLVHREFDRFYRTIFHYSAHVRRRVGPKRRRGLVDQIVFDSNRHRRFAGRHVLVLFSVHCQWHRTLGYMDNCVVRGKQRAEIVREISEHRHDDERCFNRKKTFIEMKSSRDESIKFCDVWINMVSSWLPLPGITVILFIRNV